jgi:MFS family permease
MAFSIGNLCGPLVLGPLFDSWGRKQMIAGVLLGLSAVWFDAGRRYCAVRAVSA